MSGNGQPVRLLIDRHFTVNDIYQFVGRVPTKQGASVFFECPRQFNIVFTAFFIDTNNGLPLLDDLPDFIVHPLAFVSVLTNHHYEGLSPTYADAELAGNDGIRMTLVVIVFLLHRAVAGIATMILKILLEGI